VGIEGGGAWPEGVPLLAHSSSKPGRAGQPYAEHVENVRKGAVSRAQAMVCSMVPYDDRLCSAIEAAAEFHDLGKLDPDIQSVLRSSARERLVWDHIDAGVAHLGSQDSWMAAWMVRAHHSPGLPCHVRHFGDPQFRRLRGRRDDEQPERAHQEQIDRTDGKLAGMLERHEATLGKTPAVRMRPQHGLKIRLALSCLVDADHSDSARHDGSILPSTPAATRWAERLEQLSQYVRGLPSGVDSAEQARNRSRREFFEACLSSAIKAPVVACQGPVGIGKTTAVTAYLLRRARDEGLRRLFIIAPFTNILTQTAKRLREALVLPDEEPDSVLLEHHHRADFSAREDRALAVLWEAPVVLTTAVSFFETLASCNPAELRKLHNVPGSAIFIDESHAALPAHLWRQNWNWLCELAEIWGCRVVLASGSLAKWWECPDLVDRTSHIPELMPADQLEETLRVEKNRVQYRQAAPRQVLTVDGLIEKVANSPGPRLVILNTVQNAAIVARGMRGNRHRVLHLSNALTPRDRSVVLNRVEAYLRDGWPEGDHDWTLVATSCVEAGVDLSFRCAFRERFSTASTLQVGGRVNRHGEYSAEGGAVVYDFALADLATTQHPAARVSADILLDKLMSDQLNQRPPAEVVTAAMVEEVNRKGRLGADLLAQAEKEHDYPKVRDLAHIISADTRFVVVDKELQRRMGAGEPVRWRDLLDGSVQLWAKRIDTLSLQRVPGLQDVYAWTDAYDSEFLGIMKGILDRLVGNHSDSGVLIY